MYGTFSFLGQVHPYLADSYNGTRFNERAVEVPVALYLLNHAAHVLEVGAVLPHYLPGWPLPDHVVVDLYEKYPGVINDDVLSWEPYDTFDLIVSISTLDHLLSAEDVCLAVERMKSWLAPGGTMLITLPHGQPSSVGGGPWLDELVEEGTLGMAQVRMDKVDAMRHLWAEVMPPAEKLAYNGRSAFANTVTFLIHLG